MAERVYYKPLYLYSQEFAERIGVPAEGPVFLVENSSPPQAYRVGQESRSKHITLFETRPGYRAGWEAHIEPLSEIFPEARDPRREGVYTATEVRVLGIYAYDFSNMRSREPLSEGKLITAGGDMLFPVKHGFRHNYYDETPYIFRATKAGEVYFARTDQIHKDDTPPESRRRRPRGE